MVSFITLASTGIYLQTGKEGAAKNKWTFIWSQSLVGTSTLPGRLYPWHQRHRRAMFTQLWPCKAPLTLHRLDNI